MNKGMGLLLAAGLVWLGGSVARAASPEDDLAVIKRALQKSPEATKTGGKPQWLHIRVEGKTNKKEKVSINIPFAVVEAMGDQEITRGRDVNGERKTLRFSEILKNLEAGQSLMEVEDADSTVRIWLD